MSRFSYRWAEPEGPAIGVIALRTDETLEQDLRRLLPLSARLHLSRVPSAVEVTEDTLGRMEAELPAAAALLPDLEFDAIGYGCTSATSVIGAERVAGMIRAGARCRAVTEPLSALVAACAALGVGRLALLSPYVETVSQTLRTVLSAQGVETPVFGSFEEVEDWKVVRISPGSVREAAIALARAGQVEGVFLSCTNLRTLESIAEIKAATGLPVLSSNQVLAWHLCRLAAMRPAPGPFGKLMLL